MALFELEPKIEAKIRNAQLQKKLKEKKKKDQPKRNDVLSVIEYIRKDVDQNLGEYKDKYQIITDEQDFADYIKASNEAGYISIDTETTGLDPIEEKLAGLCLYTPGQKPAYVPINHEDYITGERYDYQLTEEQVAKYLKQLTAKVIMFNAVFDLRFIRNQLGVRLTCYWDALIAAKLMNENEPSHQLKKLHDKYVARNNKKAKSFSDLFSGISFVRIPIDCAYLYAANDAIITYELFEFQSKILNPNARKDLADVYFLFMNIEMPIVDVICDMEDTGVDVDLDFVDYLSKKYHEISDEKEKAVYNEINKHQSKIDAYKRQNPNRKLDDPIKLSSPTQLSILLYDILELKSPDKEKPRGTGEDILIRLNTSFTEALLDYRHAQKILTTYVDKMPHIMHEDGRVRCSFNQLGAKTGRFSSNGRGSKDKLRGLNLQNIPSSNKEIRKMFIGGTEIRDVEPKNNIYSFDKCEEVQLEDESWIFVEQLKEHMKLINGQIINQVKIEPGLLGKVKIQVEGEV